MDIRLIAHEDIDKVKWNSCVHYATNGNVFGYKWYLDNIAKEWDGLVEGDYESVLPLFTTDMADTLDQPELIREGGIYSIHLLSQARIKAFLDAIPDEYKNVYLQLNEGIQLSKKEGFEINKIPNYQLLLLSPYESIREKYSPEVLRFLKSSDRKNLLPSSNVKPEKIAQLFKDTNPDTLQNEDLFHGYQRIMYNALHRGWGATFGVMDLNKKLLSAAFIIYGQGRAMVLVAATSPEGKSLGAFDYLMDNFLQSHAGRPMVLDFNSSLKGPERYGASANFFLQLKKGVIERQKEIVPKRKSWRFW